MKRKAIQLANKTIVVSLPIKWIKQQGIKKGDEIDLKEQDNSLLVSKEKSQELKKLTINLSEVKEIYARVIICSFNAGYDEIKIKFSTNNEIEKIQETIREKLWNVIIKEIDKESITLGRLHKDGSEEFDIALKRFFIIINNIAHETLDAFEKNDYDWLKRIVLIK